MATPVFVDSNTQDSGGALSLTFTIPAGAQSGDFMIAFVKQSENTGQQTWDDDGGGGNGWTREAYNRTTGGRDQETAVYWKIHSGSESNPTFTWNTSGTTEPMSGSLLVYRNVDNVEPFTELTFLQAQNDANPPNPTVEIKYINSRVICFHAATHDDISSVAAPTGFALRTQVWNGTSNDHRNHFTADIEIDTIGDYTPPDWQHSVLNTTPEYHTYSIALNEEQPIHITGGTAIQSFNWGDQNLTITGDGFGGSQLTGKVEYWDDTSGTTKTLQGIDSWSDTSIQIDTTQGSLPNNTVVYLVVTNDNGDASAPIGVAVGLLPYSTLVVDSLNCDHYWRLNNTYDDTGDTGPARNMTQGIIGTWTFSTNNLVDDNTHSLVMDNVTDRREAPDSANMNITITSAERTLSFWFQTNTIQHELASVWKEGGGVQNLAFLTGYGNVMLFQGADNPGNAINAQAWSDFKLTPNRPYHICGRYSLTEDPKELRLYIDGIEQTATSGNPLGTGNFDSHSGDIVWGDPDTNLETGGTDISYNGPTDAYLSDFASWSDNSAGTNSGALDKTTEIRDILFRRGAIPDDVISSDTEVNMQSALDATADSRPDWPLSYRIEPPSGGGDLELVMTDKQFDSRVTEHLEWRGSDTLTIVRPTSSNFDENKAFASSGGTITVVDEVDVEITVLDIDDSSPVEGVRVRLTAAAGGDLPVGTVIVAGTTNASGYISDTLRFTNPQPVTGVVRKGTSSTYYQETVISATIVSTGLSTTAFMIKDE